MHGFITLSDAMSYDKMWYMQFFKCCVSFASQYICTKRVLFVHYVYSHPFPMEVAELVKAEINRSGDPQKLLASADV